MRAPPSQSDSPGGVLDCCVARCERIDVAGSSSSLVRVTVELAGSDRRALAAARLLTTDGGEQRWHDALPAPVRARGARLTLGFAVSGTATALALELAGRSLPLVDPRAVEHERIARQRLQLDALGCVSRELRATRAGLEQARDHAARMTAERDDARRAAARAEAAAYDASAGADTVRRTASAPAGDAAHGPAVTAPAAQRASPRTAVALCALCSTVIALAILGWPTRDGTPDSGAAVAAASAAGEHATGDTPAVLSAGLARELQIPVDYLALYRSAGTRYGLDWTRLAAVGAIESIHGQARAAGVSSGANARGARGPAQFLAGTWDRFGLDGDADGRRDALDPADAIPAMASYLRASGAPQDWTGALRSYNHSDAYVDAVEQLAASYRARSPASR